MTTTSSPTDSAAALTRRDYRIGRIRHLVLFKYRDAVSQNDRDEVTKRFLLMQATALRDGQPYIASIEAGLQTSHEGLGHGFEQGFLVTFGSEGDRNYYVGEPFISDPKFFDPVHQAFKAFVRPLLDENMGVLVFDMSSE